MHLLVENAVDAIQEKKGRVIGETIKVTAEVVHDGSEYCEFCFWNSSTKFAEPILAHAGYRPYTTAPRRSHSGLGFFIIEQLLRLGQAKSVSNGRHFNLSNTQNPVGARVSFALPLKNTTP